MKIFIADDSSLIRERLAALLSEIKSVELVGQARDVRETIEGVRCLRPDVVILDIRMPGRNGVEALKAIRALKMTPIIIMLTAFPGPQYREKCLAAGADYFFDKAAEFDRVAEVLEEMSQKKATTS